MCHRRDCTHFSLLWGEDEHASLVDVVDGYSRDIGMEFGMDKCAVLTMEGGKESEE